MDERQKANYKSHRGGFSYIYFINFKYMIRILTLNSQRACLFILPAHVVILMEKHEFRQYKKKKCHLSNAWFEKSFLQSFSPVMAVVNTFSREPSQTPGKRWLMRCGSIVFTENVKKHLTACIRSTGHTRHAASSHTQFVSERLSPSISIIFCARFT